MSTDFTQTARQRFLAALHARENFMTIPQRGTKIAYFTRRQGTASEINIHVDVDTRFRGKNKQRRIEQRPTTPIKIRYKRMDLSQHPDTQKGHIVYMTPPDFVRDLLGILAFVNLYLETDIRMEDINQAYFNPRQNPVRIRIKDAALKYQGDLWVHLV